jgi:hypothetical protein
MSKPLPIFLYLLLILAVGSPFSSSLHAAGESARIEVILVEAGNGDQGVDPALRQYAATLQRLFRFGSYKQVASRTIRLDVPGEESVSLGAGQSLTLSGKQNSGKGLMAELTWTRGSKRLLHTRIQLRPGTPAVLGGPRSGKDNGSYLLILESRP